MYSYINRFSKYVFIFSMALFFACEDDTEELSLNVIATPMTVAEGDTVLFEIAGNAETFAIFTGDRGHNYDSSFLAIADGKELDLGALVLPADSLDSAAAWLENVVIGFNIATNNANEDLLNDTTIEESDKILQDTVVFEDMMADLRTSVVGVTFPNVDAAAYAVSRDGMPLLPNSTARTLVEEYFVDQGTYLAPVRGYDVGVALDKYDLEYSYAYERSGTYTVTVIATEVSLKNYNGSGYKADRSASANEYEYNRLIRQVEITVQ